MAWEPSTRDYLDVFAAQNPWQEMGKVPAEFAKPTLRPLARVLWKAVETDAPPRYQLILGPRRVGKTTVMYQTVQQLIQRGIAADRLWWFRMDHPLLMETSLFDWIRWLVGRSRVQSALPYFVFLDEVNYAENWDLWLKTFYDERWPIRVVATSSSTAALRNRMVESGIGRWSEQYLSPYLYSEYLGLMQCEVQARAEESLWGTLIALADSPKPKNLLRMFLLLGGFPELLLAASTPPDEESQLFRSQQTLRAEAVQRVVGMDIPQVFHINEPRKLERLLYILAGQIGGLVSITNLARCLEFSRPSVDQYLHYLERAFLVFTVPAYSGSEETIQRRGRKVYFADGAVRNAALQRGLAPMNDPAEMGLLYENAVAAHLNSLSLQDGQGRLFYWRQQGTEVDFVYEERTGALAVEVSASESHGTSALVRLQEAFPHLRGRCFLVTPSPRVSMPDESGSIGRYPLDRFLLAVGLQSQRALESRLGPFTQSENLFSGLE